MKKKNGLFKVLMLLLLLIIVLSYFIEGRQGAVSYIALGETLLNYLQSFYYFFDTVLFVLAVGAFYGVLNKIPAYKKLINDIVNKMEDKSKTFVIATTIVFALLSAFTGLNLILLLFIPMIVSIVLLLGYDKLVALSSTIGGVIVGLIGGLFITVRDSSNYYGVSFTTLDKLVGLESHFGNAGIKVLLLVLSIGLLVWYITSHIKKVESKEVDYELSKEDSFFVETKLNKKEAKKKAKTWPLILVLLVSLALMVLGYLPWNSLFELDCFDKFHESVTKVTFNDWKYVFLVLFTLIFVYTGYKMIKKAKEHEFDKKFYTNGVIALISLGIASIFAGYSLDFLAKTDFGKWTTSLPLWDSGIFTTLLSSSFSAFGTWASLGSFLIAIVVVVVAILALKLIYNIKSDDIMDGAVTGLKAMLPAVMLIGLAYCVLITSYNNGFIETIIKNCEKSFSNNAIIHSLVVMFGSILNVDLYYTSSGIFTPVVSSLTDKANLNVYAVMFQSLYGLVQLVGPTSILLIAGLTYLEVPYQTWLKYIWRLIVELLIIILLVLMLVSMM